MVVIEGFQQVFHIFIVFLIHTDNVIHGAVRYRQGFVDCHGNGIVQILRIDVSYFNVVQAFFLQLRLILSPLTVKV